MGETFNRRSTLCVSLGSTQDGRTQCKWTIARASSDNAPWLSVACEGIKHEFLRQRAFSGATSCLTCQCCPSSRQLTHLWSGTLSERPFVFPVYSTGTRPLGQAIFGTWTRHSTPWHMPNLRAAGRLMPVAQASDRRPSLPSRQTFEDRTEP
jgi:hypothetical protein